ncbi:NAD(P)/FAD-dependent oxidoreductase [Croceitalea rosinachiae]|uniref:FAD-dependent oxidoreductase n=1 Tax=Croceitalea rosinachiae TaxID=3075596 RepID=A0ABU3A838_9FLAO|nr:FAD-dependent oxidoreductase [Croceitalea sp. F388]MDT0606353.1 FAD-dependent oxidoreductase [Croceitalea sp. F388]
MELSYWEYKTWLSNIDFTIVGSGIVGLNTALHLKKRFPKAKILILEKGILPQGASTKNAGFACFGSISEVLSDLKSHTEEEVVQLAAQRFKGIQLLREILGDENLGYENLGGHELFLNKDLPLFEKCQSSTTYINKLLKPVFKKPVFKITRNTCGFKNINQDIITHTEEGQIDTGRMMNSLLNLVQKKGILILNSVQVEEFEEKSDSVLVKAVDFEFHTKKLLIATNGFASKLLDEQVEPARAQVMITRPIKNLHIKGTFHFDEGYYYFRNLDNRILFGGGRNLDFHSEKTDAFGQTELIQAELERLLNHMILPNIEFEIDYRWSGIMGVGQHKKPIVKQLSKNVFCGVRLGGMGIAIGSSVGKELANLL